MNRDAFFHHLDRVTWIAPVSRLADAWPHGTGSNQARCLGRSGMSADQPLTFLAPLSAIFPRPVGYDGAGSRGPFAPLNRKTSPQRCIRPLVRPGPAQIGVIRLTAPTRTGSDLVGAGHLSPHRPGQTINRPRNKLFCALRCAARLSSDYTCILDPVPAQRRVFGQSSGMRRVRLQAFRLSRSKRRPTGPRATLSTGTLMLGHPDNCPQLRSFETAPRGGSRDGADVVQRSDVTGQALRRCTCRVLKSHVSRIFRQVRPK